jgi:hypothetical protein
LHATTPWAAGERDCNIGIFFGMLYLLKPRVVTLAKREASNNQPVFWINLLIFLTTAPLFLTCQRLHYPPQAQKGLELEQLWFRKEIATIVACGELEHIRRYQNFSQWQMASFQLLPTSNLLSPKPDFSSEFTIHQMAISVLQMIGAYCWVGKIMLLFAISSWNSI